MKTALKRPLFAVLALFALPALGLSVPAFANINKNVRIDAGEESDGGSSVNGNIKVGDRAIVRGDLTTVNGGITLGDNVKAQEVESVNGQVRIGDGCVISEVSTVNGRLRLGKQVEVETDVSTVNGQIDIDAGSTIGGEVTAVNGKLTLDGATVRGDIQNVNGGMELLNGTRIEGDLVVRKPNNKGWSWGKRTEPRIVIGRDVVIEGKLRFEQAVELYVHESVTIPEMTDEKVDIIRFDGDSP